MANGNGDMRLALQACAQAADLAAKEAAAAAADARDADAATSAVPAGASRVGMRQMAAALSELTGAPAWRLAAGGWAGHRTRSGVARAASPPLLRSGSRLLPMAPTAPNLRPAHPALQAASARTTATCGRSGRCRPSSSC